MSFDPYRKWLGIPDNRRPPNYYELLGITAGEKDADVIRSAIDQRRMYVRSKLGEGQDSHVKAILGLIEEATSTLLVPEFKHGYDRQLGLHLKKGGSRRSYILPSWMESRVVRVYGGGSGIVGDLFGIVTILLAAFGLMAWWSFTLQRQELTGDKSNEMTWMEKAVLGDAPKQNDNPAEPTGDISSPTKSAEGKATVTSSDPEQWLTEVSTLGAELQIDEIRKKLIELNPKFDGKLVTKIVDGKVSELSFITDHVSEISPLRALKDLKVLSMQGSPGENGLDSGLGTLSDISALKGMQLKSLNVHWNDITDLSSLSGMPLISLDIGLSKQIRSLSALKGMDLVYFRCAYTNVSDLSPLRGMPIRILDIRRNQSTDFSLLRDFPLDYLDIRGTKIEDLSPLIGKRLDTLWCGNTNVASIEPLRGMPITSLGLQSTKVRDLTPLKDMPLKTLFIDKSSVTDLTPIGTAKLERLSFSPSQINLGIAAIRKMQSIKAISDAWWSEETPDKFWKRFDEGEFDTMK